MPRGLGATTLNGLQSITIRGFRSIQELDGFRPGRVTVLIGPNGAGKSNFVEFFRMLREMADETFQRYVLLTGSENLFFGRPARTPKISARLEFDQNVYEFELLAVPGGGAVVAEERVQYTGGAGLGKLKKLGGPSPESTLKAKRDEPAQTTIGRGVPGHVYESISSWTVYHVHDTRPNAPVRSRSSASNNIRLTHDASNLAAVLLHLKASKSPAYARIVETVRIAAPFFDDFVLRPQEVKGESIVALEWQHRGSQEPFQAATLSDGTIRFIALATALLQPSPPSTVLIDEPELGLHPSAIHVLGETIRAVSQRTQVIVATQSPLLLNAFDPEEIVVVERDGERSVFRRLERESVEAWLEEYSLGQLWLKNLLGGRP